MYMIGVILLATVVSGASLETVFRTPPNDAKPQTWYHLMNGNVTKEGITRDFEALAEAGFGGVQMFDAGCDIPPGGLDFNSPEWFELLRHAAVEAKRLGLEICIPNCSGWSSSGGPWNPPSNGMKRVVFSATRVSGPRRFSGVLPRERKDSGYYEDIATLAYRLPSAESESPSLPSATLITPLATPKDAVERLSDGAEREVLQMSRSGGDSNVVTLVYAKNFPVRGLDLQLAGGNSWTEVVNLSVEVSEDGRNFTLDSSHDVHVWHDGVKNSHLRTLPLKRAWNLRALRVRFKFAASGRSDGFTLGELVPTNGRRISEFRAKTFAISQAVVEDEQPAMTDQVIDRNGIVNLTNRLSSDGSLAWDVPAGEWEILRVGAVCNGRCNHPASDHGRGLEVDKLSAAAMDHHFEAYVARLCRHLGSLAGDVPFGLNNILVDSYEVASQNWTQGLDAEFRKRCGYDLVPYLPVFSGRIVGGVEESERVLEDFRRVVADLFAENYAGALARKCHQYGLRLSIEAYGNSPSDDLQYGQYADIPMGEFWAHVGNPYRAKAGNAKQASMLAHVWGRKYCATESFTASPGPNAGRWMTTPFDIKHQSDKAFCAGVNRLIYHRYVHQPWADDRYLPGMTMGRWGMHLDRTQTWWPYAKPFFRYQARCQGLLQRGRFVADILFFVGEKAPNKLSDFSVPFGYDYDACATAALMGLKVENGEIVVPGGVRYRLLVLPPDKAMSPSVLRKVIELRDAGASIAMSSLPTRAPGLSHGADGDRVVRDLAQRAVDSGVLLMSVGDAIRHLGLEPQISFGSLPKDIDVAWIHRAEADVDWFFTAVPSRKPVELELSFRVRGRVPEIWDAESGRIFQARAWHEENGRTVVRIPYDVCGSKFVVFRSPAAVTRHVAAAVRACPHEPVSLQGPWQVEFPHGFLPNPLAKGKAETVTFEHLDAWNLRPENGIRYFSGTAIYRKQFDLPLSLAKDEKVILELGRVREVAEVTVNGKTFDATWHPPFQVDITSAVRAGKNDLVVRVANLWANRLIGDDREFAPDCEWKGGVRNGVKEIGIKEIPQWVKDGKPSPTGRHTFTTWKHWSKDDELLESGLLGPVKLRFAVEADCGLRFATASPLGGAMGDLPAMCRPAEIVRRITDQFLSANPIDYRPEGYHGNDGYGWNRTVVYSVVSLWANALDCAALLKDDVRKEKLIRKFDPFLPQQELNWACSQPNHVDDAIFGALPLAIYLQNKDADCREMGLYYADTQWAPPNYRTYTERDNAPREKQREYYARGFSPQTRLWIDDMYMIGFLQGNAFRATGDVKYIGRTASEMRFYLDALQVRQGPQEGLFYHAPDVPYVWGRGDGWMAAAMALILEALPSDHADRPRIVEGYERMMAKLLSFQRADGMWCQLVDSPDDPQNWGETSSTAMFAYAFAAGVRRGWLPVSGYGEATRKAWLALCAHLDEHANLTDVCAGTGKKNDRRHYLERPRVCGDPHGQAPMLWLAGELLKDGIR